MEQPALFYDSFFEALRDDVLALGGPKVVGKQLFPAKEVEAARNTLNDCLNADRREHLTHEQEQWIMREAREARGFSAAIYFVCDTAGFERPKALNPEDEKVALQREVVEAARTFRHTVDRLEKLAQPPLQAVK